MISLALQVFPVTPQEDAQDAYDAAVQRANAIKAAWLDLGEPIVASGSTGQVIAHPLLKAMNEADSLADRLRQRVVARHAGPDPAAVVTARIGLSPSGRLRAEQQENGAQHDPSL